MKANDKIVNCPECDAPIVFEREPMRGEVNTCRECGVEVEVIDLGPLTVDLAPEVEEDWGE